MSVNNASPATFLGGTWVSWGTGRVPVGIDTSQTEFNSIEKTGGEKTHTLAIAEMPNHSHSLHVASGTEGTSTYYNLKGNWFSSIARNTDQIDSTGGGGAHNNLQPYITCYMWKRTA